MSIPLDRLKTEFRLHCIHDTDVGGLYPRLKFFVNSGTDVVVALSVCETPAQHTTLRNQARNLLSAAAVANVVTTRDLWTVMDTLHIKCDSLVWERGDLHIMMELIKEQHEARVARAGRPAPAARRVFRPRVGGADPVPVPAVAVEAAAGPAAPARRKSSRPARAHRNTVARAKANKSQRGKLARARAMIRERDAEIRLLKIEIARLTFHAIPKRARRKNTEDGKTTTTTTGVHTRATRACNEEELIPWPRWTIHGASRSARVETRH